MYFTGGAAVCLQEEGQMGGQEFQPYPRTASGQTHPCGGLLPKRLRPLACEHRRSAATYYPSDRAPNESPGTYQNERRVWTFGPLTC